MIHDLVAEHVDVLVAGSVFIITFVLFIFWLVWSNIISKNYIKYCEEMTKNDK